MTQTVVKHGLDLGKNTDISLPTFMAKYSWVVDFGMSSSDSHIAEMEVGEAYARGDDSNEKLVVFEGPMRH
jgi:hypothetical protein